MADFNGVTAFFHSAEPSGPAHTLAPRLVALGDELGGLRVVFPGDGPAAGLYPTESVVVADYRPITAAGGIRGTTELGAALWRGCVSTRREIHAHPPKLAVVVTTYLPAVLVATRSRRIPSLVYAAEVLGTGRGARATTERALARATSRLATSIVACSDLVASQFSPRKVTRIYPGVSLLSGTPRFRHDGEIVLATVGSITEGRGHETLLRALAEVRKGEPRAVAIIAGVPHSRRLDEPFRARLEALVKELRLEGAVRFLGAVKRIEDVYASADIVVNPAHFPEPFGRAAQEALLAGTPVVATLVGAVAEVLEHERTALLVPPRDPEALAAAIQRMLGAPLLRQTLVREGQRQVRRRFDEQQGTEAFLAVALSMIDEAGCRAEPKTWPSHRGGRW